MPLGLTVAALATDAAIQTNIFGSGTTSSVFSNEDLNDIMTIVKSLKNAGLLIKVVTGTVGNEVKEQKG